MRGMLTDRPINRLLKLKNGRVILHQHVITVRKEMTGRRIHLHLALIHLNRMIVHPVVQTMMIVRAIHQEMIPHRIMHHNEKVLRKEKALLPLVALWVEAAVVDIHQVEAVPVILPEDPAILQVVHRDQVHLQEAGDNSNIMI